MLQKEKDNLLRWDGRRLGFYEVYYLKWNDEESRTAAWIRYTLTSPNTLSAKPYCELWGIFFDAKEPKNNFAVKQRYPIAKLAWGKERFFVRIAGAELHQESCHGALTDEQEGNSLTWDLKFESNTDTYRYFPYKSFYTGGFPKTKGLSPHVDAMFSGTLSANGREIRLSGAPGQQTHLWGVKHGLRWAWGHCNAFAEDDDAVWEGLDAQVKLGPVQSPHFKLFYLKHQGREYYFNTLKSWFTNTSIWSLGRWEFEMINREIQVRGIVNCDYDELVAVTYTDPDGELLWCNNSKVASIHLSLFDKNNNCIGNLTSDKACAAEFVDRKTYPEVPVRI